MVGSVVLFLILETINFSWRLNKVFPVPCSTGPGDPCYAIYDIWLVIIMAGIFILSLLTAIVKIILFVRVSKKL